MQTLPESQIIQDAFSFILNHHSKHHIYKTPLLIKYLRQKTNNPEEIQEILNLQERIFFTIDDTIDNAFDNQEKYYNEIVKFLSQSQLTHLLFSHLSSKKISPDIYFSSLSSNIQSLLEIPQKEKEYEKKFSQPTKELIIENQLNRSSHLSILLSSSESLLSLNINKDEFLFFNALQLIRKDYQDLQRDIQKNSNNIFRFLSCSHLHLTKQAAETLFSQINESILKKEAEKELQLILATSFNTS